MGVELVVDLAPAVAGPHADSLAVGADDDLVEPAEVDENGRWRAGAGPARVRRVATAAHREAWLEEVDDSEGRRHVVS